MIGTLFMSLALATTNIPTRLAIYVDEGARNTGVYRLLELSAFSPDLEAIPVDAAMIRAGALEKADVLVMPGGSASLQSKTLGSEGRDAIRAFVKKGGGYFGICAGCFLAIESSPSHPEMLHLAPFASDGPEGTAMMMIRFNQRATDLAGIKKGRHELRFAAGPVMSLARPVEEAEFEILATYDSDVNPEGEAARKSFAGQAAVIAGTFGKGRVFASALHPEYTYAGHAIVRGAFKFLTGRDMSWRLPPRRVGQRTVALDTRTSFGVPFATKLLDLLRAHEVDLMPVNNEAVADYALYHVDDLIAPHSTDLTLPQPPTTNPQPPTPNTKSPIRVAAYAGKGGADYYISTRLALSPDFKVTVVDGADIASGCLKDFDLVLMPGGSCKGECEGMGPTGCTNLVNFIKGGGKYYGVCAGAFLASQVNDPAYPRLGFIPYRDENEPVYRGGCDCRLRVTDEGRAVFPASAEYRRVCYNGGPVFVPGDPIADTDVKVLMTYECDTISTRSPKPVMSMRGKGAMLGGRVGRGKVFISGPHPEGDVFTDDIVDGGIAFLTGVRPTPRLPVRRPGQLVVRFKYTQDKAAVDFYLNRLLPDARFDVRGGASGLGLRHVDVCIVPKPTDEYLGSDMQSFAEQGGRVIVLVKDEAATKDAPWRRWAMVARSYDEIYDMLAPAAR